MAVQFVASCELPTQFGTFEMHGFEDPDTGQEHIALTLGNVHQSEHVLCAFTLSASPVIVYSANGAIAGLN